jgi:hypothetical protein
MKYPQRLKTAPDADFTLRLPLLFLWMNDGWIVEDARPVSTEIHDVAPDC